MKKGKLLSFLLTMTVLLLGPYLYSAPAYPEKELFTWLVKVESRYYDELEAPQQSSASSQKAAVDKHKQVSVVGTGLLVKVNNRFFVATNSHLAEGQNLEMSLPSLNKTLIPLEHALLSGRSGTFLPHRPVTFGSVDIVLIPIQDPEVSSTHWFFWDETKEGFIWNVNNLFSQEFLTDSNSFKVVDKITGVTFFSPIASWVKKKPESLNDSNKILTNNSQRSLWYDWSKTDIMTDGRISAGMSGAPLLHYFKNQNILALIGLARSYHRYFPRSYFTSAHFFATVANSLEDLQSFLAPQEVRKTQWHYRSDIGFYRTYGFGYSEINTETHLAGGGDTIDGGGGDTSDGGMVSKSLTKQKDNHSNEYETMDLRFGMIWDHKPIMGIRFLHNVSHPLTQSFSDNYTVYAEHNTDKLANFIEQQDPQVHEALVLSTMPLMSLLSVKVNNALYYQNLQDFKKSPCLIDKSALDRGKIKIRLLRQLDSGKEVSIVFELNSQGILTGGNKKKFEPFIKVGKQNSFIVDLKGLFFMVVTDMRIPLEDFSSISEIMRDSERPMSSYYARLPYVYFQRSPKEPAMPAFCKVVSDPSAFINP